MEKKMVNSIKQSSVFDKKLFETTAVDNQLSAVMSPSKIASPVEKLTPRNTLSALLFFKGAKFDDPGSRSKEIQETRELSLKQVTYARNLLYNPGKAVRLELSKAAEKLESIIGELSNTELSLLTKRLFSDGGLLDGQPLEKFKTILYNLKNDSESTTAIDRAAFICLLGDIGALYADAKKISTIVSSLALQKISLRKHLSKVVAENGLSPISPAVADRVAKTAGGAGTVGPKKSSELKKTDRLPRTGLHDLGKEADDNLEIPLELRIPEVSWNLAHIDTRRSTSISEPLVGHMSGSPGEILMAWDMLCGRPENDIYTGALARHEGKIKSDNKSWNPLASFSAEEKNAQLARLSGACSMLISLGYHSAVEVAEGALKYTGQNIRTEIHSNEDAADLLGNGAATDIISELFYSFSAIK